jgi:alpha-1,2-mannosyltransferase
MPIVCHLLSSRHLIGTLIVKLRQVSLSRHVLVRVAGLLALNVAIWTAVHRLSPSGGETTWTHLHQFLQVRQGADSWKPMETARAYLSAHPNHLYEEIFFTRGVKFQYPVTALLFIGHATRPLLSLVSWAATLAAAVLSAVILRDGLRRAEPSGEHKSNRDRFALYVTATALALSFYPLVKAFSLGQIQTWLDAAFALLVLCWGRERRRSSGVLLGFLCLVKPTWALLLGWAAVRRQWGMLLSALSMLAAGSALAMWLYGSIDALGYVRVLSFIARRGEAFYANQSFNGLLNRLVGNGSNLEWRYFDFPPIHPWVAAGTTIALVILTALAWYVPARTAGAGGVIDVCIAALTLTMTAPIAWEHHYGIMLPIYAAVTPGLLRDRPLGSWTAPLLAVSFVMASNFWPQTNRFAASYLNPLQSYLLGAALILLLLMYRALEGPESCVTPAT